MSNKLRNAAAAIFALCCLAFFGWWNVTKPRVLILQSYDPSYSWTREVDVGLHRVLDAKLGYSIRWHYMDTKRHPWEDYMRRASISARKVIDQWRPNVVIAIDDDAQNYVMSNYVNDPTIRIVFAGINGEISTYGYDKANNATGIVERVPWGAIRDALLSSSLAKTGKPIRMLELGDRSESVQYDAKQMQQFDWTPIKSAGVRLVDTFDDWKTQVQSAPAQADVILLGNYRRLVATPGKTDLVDPKEVVAWTEANSKLPLIGTNGYNYEDGGMFAISASPYEQGETAARTAIRILDHHTATTEIPVERTRQFMVFMRADGLAARGLQLPAFYESFARATNTYTANKGGDKLAVYPASNASK